MKYLDKEILESMRSTIYEHRLRVGRRVNIINGEHKGNSGVIQNVTHVQSKPLIKDKIRIWLDGFSCIDIFDFEITELELIPYEYINGLGYF